MPPVPERPTLRAVADGLAEAATHADAAAQAAARQRGALLDMGDSDATAAERLRPLADRAEAAARLLWQVAAELDGLTVTVDTLAADDDS